MRLELTDDEMATVRKVIRRHEKQARWPRFNRWGGVLAALMCVGCGVWYLHMAERLFSHPFGSPPDGSSREMSTAPATQVDIDLVRSEAVLSSTLFTRTYIMGFFTCGFAGWWLGFAVTKWNRDKEPLVFAKILRLLTETPAEPS